MTREEAYGGAGRLRVTAVVPPLRPSGRSAPGYCWRGILKSYDVLRDTVVIAQDLPGEDVEVGRGYVSAAGGVGG